RAFDVDVRTSRRLAKRCERAGPIGQRDGEVLHEVVLRPKVQPVKDVRRVLDDLRTAGCYTARPRPRFGEAGSSRPRGHSAEIRTPRTRSGHSRRIDRLVRDSSWTLIPGPTNVATSWPMSSWRSARTATPLTAR